MSDERGSVELVDVTKRFGSMLAVDKLTLEVHAGEFLSLLGPSGCGKTTTLRMLAGFDQPDEGFIRISGSYVQGIPPYKRDVNTVFQQYALFPHMTVSENVAYGLRQKKVPRGEISGRVAEALDMVKMTKLADRKHEQTPTGSFIARARRLARFLPFHRLYHSVELTILIFVAAVVGTFLGEPTVDRFVLVALVPLAFLSLVGHFVAIMASKRVRS